MINRDLVIKERVDSLSERYSQLKENFKSIYDKLKEFEYKQLTQSNIQECQMIIDRFLEQNNLKISVYVEVYEQNLVVLGRTIIDEIVWESIQDKDLGASYTC